MRPLALDPRLAALLGRVWPALPAVAARAAALGFRWADVSTPFVRWQGDRAIAHVGVIDLPLVIDGRRVHVGSVHAVCTDPALRGQGHCRALLEEALAFCDARYETVVLTTLIPDLYAKFGFRPLREHGFVRRVTSLRPARCAPPLRALSVDAPDDVRLLRRLLARRAPVSGRVGSLEEGTVLIVALLLTWGDFSRVHHHEALDVVTVHAVRDRTLLLYDVVGPTLPPLEAVDRGHRRRSRGRPVPARASRRSLRSRAVGPRAGAEPGLRGRHDPDGPGPVRRERPLHAPAAQPDLITWGAPTWPPKPPTLRAPAEPWRFASVQSDRSTPKWPYPPSSRRSGRSGRVWRPSVAAGSLPAGKRGVKDLPVSGAKAKNAKGGVSSAISEVMKNFGGALQTAARGG
jgi:GNAT superfamily N-acetyltransferase